ncbi:hypothetical protein CHARACLAT_017467 [Characodon lateralis]|uniref:Uncharacterized protein n=1 Tax=Characodon lateralis TaxID=208331 RepID=A0ABU7DBW6_9TELE|nr:hypothetical protein [Characodon lateralis]
MVLGTPCNKRVSSTLDILKKLQRKSRGAVVTQAENRILLLGGDHTDSPPSLLALLLAGYDACLRLLYFLHSRTLYNEAGLWLIGRVTLRDLKGDLEIRSTFQGWMLTCVPAGTVPGKKQSYLAPQTALWM